MYEEKKFPARPRNHSNQRMLVTLISTVTMTTKVIIVKTGRLVSLVKNIKRKSMAILVTKVSMEQM